MQSIVLAGEIGIDPQPGLALLRLAQGRHEEAVAMIHRALETASDLPKKTALLPAGIEISIACDDLDTAERLCGEMHGLAGVFGTEILTRVADQGQGSLALARGAFADAVAALTRARQYWSEFGAPYLVARLRVDIARAGAELGDLESAAMELDAAEKLLPRTRRRTRPGADSGAPGQDRGPRDRRSSRLVSGKCW